jgi:hypothetical protein
MYGMETVLKLAPPLYILAALLVCPLVYAIPGTFISVDLATAFPFDGLSPAALVRHVTH